jgi:hypothetical protein
MNVIRGRPVAIRNNMQGYRLPVPYQSVVQNSPKVFVLLCHYTPRTTSLGAYFISSEESAAVATLWGGGFAFLREVIIQLIRPPQE